MIKADEHARAIIAMLDPNDSLRVRALVEARLNTMWHQAHLVGWEEGFKEGCAIYDTRLRGAK